MRLDQIERIELVPAGPSLRLSIYFRSGLTTSDTGAGVAQLYSRLVQALTQIGTPIWQDNVTV